MDRILLAVLLVFLADSASALGSPPFKFYDTRYEKEREIIENLYLKDIPTRDDTTIYIGNHSDGWHPHLAKLRQREGLPELVFSTADQGWIIAILVGKQWCSKRGCKLVKLSQNDAGEWIEQFSTVSNGSGVALLDNPIAWRIGDNAGAKIIGWKEGRYQELYFEKGWKHNDNAIPEIIKLGEE